MPSNHCSIWKTPANTRFDSHDGYWKIIDSPRVGGKYTVRVNTENIHIEKLSDPAKARLTSWLIKQREIGENIPRITPEVIQQLAENRQSMSVSERIDQVLLFLDTQTQKPGDKIKLNTNPQKGNYHDEATRRYYQLLIRSESADWEDLGFLLEHLTERKLIRNISSSDYEFLYIIEVPGFKRIEELKKFAPASDKVFVAMWFDEDLRPTYDRGFEPAIKNAGYQAVRVDLGHYSDKIDDKIISEIRQSRFIVADFSKGDDGARGSVYYEAGFAHGLGREVIFTCRKADIKDVHFDTRQYPHIVWEDADDLRGQLHERIIARMGDGPNRSQ